MPDPGPTSLGNNYGGIDAPVTGRVNSVNMQKVLSALDVKRPHLPSFEGYHEFLKLRPAFQKQIMNP